MENETYNGFESDNGYPDVIDKNPPTAGVDFSQNLGYMRYHVPILDEIESCILVWLKLPGRTQ